MVDVDTFLTTLYVMADDFCHSRPPKRRPGPKASLSSSEVITLAVFLPVGAVSTARGTSIATPTPNCAMPSPPCPTARSSTAWYAPTSASSRLSSFVLHLVALLQTPPKCPYQALDSSAMPTRDAKRRGHGWLAGQADIGWSNTIGWYLWASPCSPRSIPRGSHNRLLFRGRLQRRPAPGRDLLRRKGPTEPQVG